MRAVVLGTAGHIDHGKTALVRALTGVDCDRLPEEKRRGITLVLGFAPLVDPAGEVEISFIDVPGHDRLVHTMIAGAAGIDRVLLVVAADEGVMPQTREHLAILDLLGVRGGVVALNKCDAVDPELLALQKEELEAFLASGPLAAAPVIPCSAATGEGVEAVRAAVLACAREAVRRESEHRPFRLSVDRVFTLSGAGTVVTGTAHWGAVRVGDELESLPGGLRLRVRGLQVHGSDRGEATQGERLALQLAGASVAELPRGEQLCSPGPWRASRRLAVDLRLLADAIAIEEGDRVWLHVLAARVPAKVERIHPAPLVGGGRGRAILRLARPVFAVPGDRVVLRRPSPALTLGGGEVLDPAPPRLRRKQAAALEDLPRPWPDPGAALARWVADPGAPGAEVRELAGRLGLAEPALAAPLGRLLEGRELMLARAEPPHLVHRSAVAAVLDAARTALKAAGSEGLPLAELASRLLPEPAQRLREFYLGELRRGGVMRETEGRVFAADAAPVEDALAARVVEFYRAAAFAAPSPQEAAASLGADPRVVEGLVRSLVARKRLSRVGGKWIVHREALDGMIASLRGWGVESFDVGAFKERFSVTRKLAIPLLEWLDSERVTRREGERRRLLPPRPGSPAGA
ncbi:MAG TPA: selenocysteine-specific translation elongation factor [Thermoanaerobaculaceae bacterium]|nr:selenocysteine-specific translation elongation factor [Thermoanaerobaculaceae bacterium]